MFLLHSCTCLSDVTFVFQTESFLFNMLSSAGEKNISVSCLRLAATHENFIKEPEELKQAFLETVPRRCSDSHKSEVRRKIVNKKVLKQARFIYKSKHLSSSASASALSSQLDNLSLDSNVITKVQPKVLNSNVIPSASNSSCLLPPTSTDCCEKLSLLTANSLENLPSFCSLKQDNFAATCRPSLNLESIDDRRSSNHTNNKIGTGRRRKERTRIQSRSDKIEHKNKLVKVTSPYAPATSSCAHELLLSETNAAVCEVAAYMENYFVLPKKMSAMAEMMYT